MNLHRSRLVFLLTALGIALPLGSVRGDEPASSRVQRDAQAGQLLNEVIAAYRALPAYSDHGEFVLSMVVDGKDKTQRSPLQLSIVRPDKLVLETGLARVISDGKTLTTVIAPLKKYTTAPAPKTVTFDTVFAGGSVGSAVFGGPASPMMLVVLNFLLGDDPAKALLDLGDKLTVADDRPLDGKPCRALKLASDGGGLAFYLLIDPESKLLRAIDLTFDPKALANAFPDGQTVKIDTFRWTAGAVSTKAPADDAFAFEPGKDFARVEARADDAPAGDDTEPKFKIESLVGKPAPDFTLTLLDGKDKTRTVSKSDLAGKVVLIDFWATWCGPCLEELPEIQKLIDGYAKDKKDVVIVALSQDDDPKEPAEVRKLIESTLEKKKLVLTGGDVGKVGLDPANAVGNAFDVEGFPSVVLLDPKGVVRAAHVGFSAEVGKTLGKEIDALLAGKPIEKEKSSEAKK